MKLEEVERLTLANLNLRFAAIELERDGYCRALVAKYAPGETIQIAEDGTISVLKPPTPPRVPFVGPPRPKSKKQRRG